MKSDEGPPGHGKIEVRIGPDTHVVLEGDTAFLMRALAQIQDNAQRNALTAEGAVLAQRSREGAPIPEATAAGPEQVPPPGENIVWVVHCDDEVRTVYATAKSRFAKSPFIRALGLTQASRVYVEDKRIARALKSGSRTLWRELTPEALEAVKQLRTENG